MAGLYMHYAYIIRFCELHIYISDWFGENTPIAFKLPSFEEANHIHLNLFEQMNY